MIEIDLKLINKFFLLNDECNVLLQIEKSRDKLLIDEDAFKELVNHLRIILLKKEPHKGLYIIENEEQLLFYLAEHQFHQLRQFEKNFSEQKDFILFLSICVSIQLTFFSQDALKILSFLDKSVSLEKPIIHKINSFIESSDPRGLLYFFCIKHDISYDLIVEKELIKFKYLEPAVNKKWQKKYKEPGQPIVFWFYKSLLGRGFFFVLYTPKCRYKIEKGGCAGCNLPSVSSSDNTFYDFDISNQINYVYKHCLSDNEKMSTKEIVLSNNGSILDTKTFSNEMLLHLVGESIDNFPRVKKIILETRIDDYTDYFQLSGVIKKVKTYDRNIKLELAIGFEIFDDGLRNGYYKKGLHKEVLEKKIQSLSELGISLKIYMMFKPVPDSYMGLDSAIQDINNAGKYFSDLSKKYEVEINLHVNPTYLAPGTKLYSDYLKGLYTPLSIKDIEKLFENLNIYENISYYIGMNDEGLSTPDSSSHKDYSNYLELKDKIYNFNLLQYK